MKAVNDLVWKTLFRCLAHLPEHEVARVLDITPEQAWRARVYATEYATEEQRRIKASHVTGQESGQSAGHEEENLT